VSESAVSAKVRLVLIGTRWRSLKRPSESRLSGARPTKARSGKRVRSHRYVKPGLIYDLGACTGWFLSRSKVLAYNRAIYVLLH